MSKDYLAKSIKAIGGAKYTVAINAQVNQVDFEVTKSCAGLLLRIEDTENIHLRVHLETSDGKRQSLVSDIPLNDYLCITQKLSERVQVREVTVKDGEITTTWKQFLLLFSLNGDLQLNDDTKVIVQLFQKDLGEPFDEVKAYFEYYSIGKAGYPMEIEKQRILQSDDFRTLEVEGDDYVYIPIGVNFDYVQFEGDDIKGVRRKSYDQAHYDAAIFDIKNDISFATGGILIDTRRKQTVSLSHLNDDDIHVYRVDCIQEMKFQESNSQMVSSTKDILLNSSTESSVMPSGGLQSVKQDLRFRVNKIDM